MLTFDDGFADFYDNALPLLQRHGLTGTLVRHQRLDRRKRRVPQRAPSARHAELAPAHARSRPPESRSARTASTHPQLDQLTAGSLRQELVGGKQALEDLLGAAVPGLAYPFGYSSKAVRDGAAAAGYEYACVVGNRLASAGADRFALPRLTIGRSTRPPGFARAVAAERLPAEFAALRMRDRGLVDGQVRPGRPPTWSAPLPPARAVPYRRASG